MLGHSHATSGALAFAATAQSVPPRLLHEHLSPSEVLIGTLLCAGSALLPDLDHHDGTIANFFGPFSKVLCRVVAWISGGHRHATHSLLFVGISYAGVWAGVTYLHRPFTLGLVAVLIALAVRALHLCPPGHRPEGWLTAMALAGIGTAVVDRWIPSTPRWLPYCVALGVVAHLAGDCLTKMGCPLLWPIGSRYEIELISHTGNKMETLVLTPLMGMGTLVMLWFAALAPGAQQVAATAGH